LTEDPFQTLGLAPTLDPVQVKTAYFRALAQHPPHQNAEAFRRVRSAFETLSRPGGLAAAYSAAPFDLRTALEPYSQRFDAALEEAARRAREELSAGEAADLVTRYLSSLSFSELCSLEDKPSAQ
jgi:curved DNA-binding protein CbpA